MFMLAFLYWAAPGQAQVTTDGMLGAAQTFAGPSITIPESVGQTAGSNLFHSFSAFNLAAGESASFSGSAGIARIIARVTGGDASNIDGTLGSSIAGADLFFLNPNGVIFGPNASLNVSGSFVASTANHIEFSDGLRFSTGSSSVQLTEAAPAAFGFDAAAASLQVNNAALAVPAGERLALVGGEIDIIGPANGPFVSNMVAPGGELQLVATASAGRLPYDEPSDTSDFARLADLSIDQSAYLSGNGTGGGELLLVADDIAISGGVLIEAASLAGGDGRGIRIQAANQFTLSGASAVGTQSLASGRAGAVSISANRIEVLNGSSLFSFAFASGDARNISLTGGSEIRIAGGDSGVSQVFSFSIGAGAGGSVGLSAPDIVVENAFVRTGQASFLGSGNGNLISVTTERLQILNGGGLDSSTQGAGTGGDIDVLATESVRISGTNATGFAGGISASSGASATGSAGSIVLRTADLSIANGSIQAATTNSPGGSVTIDTQSLTITSGGNVLTSSFGAGTGGGVLLNIAASGGIAGDGPGGARTGLFSQARGAGAGGNINVVAGGVLTLSSAALVDVSATNTGAAGRVNLSVQELSVQDASITAAATRSGGGDIVINADSVQLHNAVLSSSVSGGTSRGGNLTISSQSIAALDGTSITARADQGLGGDVTLFADVFLRTSDVVTSASSNVIGNDGNVLINAPERDVASNLAGPELVIPPPPSIPAACSAGMLGQTQAVINTRFPVMADGPWPDPHGIFGGEVEAVFQAWWAGEDDIALAKLDQLNTKASQGHRKAWLAANRLAIETSRDVARAGQHAEALFSLLDNAGNQGGAAVLALSRYFVAAGISDWPMRQMYFAAERALRLSEPDEPTYSQGLAALGGLYTRVGRLEEAVKLYSKAVLDAPPLWASAWWRSIAANLIKLGRKREALAAWDQSAQPLWQHRAALARLWRGRGSTFRERYAEVFEHQVSLRLQTRQFNAQTLQAVQRDWERLKTAELAEYHGECVLAGAGDLPPRVADSTTILYPMLFEDHIKLLVRRGGMNEIRRVERSRTSLAEAVTSLRSAVTEGVDAERIQAMAQDLYRSLISPIRHHLEQSRNLVFVPDGPLRLLPPGLLHDGDRYLIQRLSLASIPGLSLIERSTKPGRGQILLAGATDVINVSGELVGVERALGDLTITRLQGDEFRIPQIRSAVASGDFDVLHLASHAYFDPQRGSGLLVSTGADSAIDSDTLRELIALAGADRKGLDLLALSACETAVGDERAALGLGGLAALTGARTALATLWEVEGGAAFTYMEAFYRGWREEGLERAEAARAATLRMLAHPYYSHPSYWAGFQLIGDWRG